MVREFEIERRQALARVRAVHNAPQQSHSNVSQRERERERVLPAPEQTRAESSRHRERERTHRALPAPEVRESDADLPWGRGREGAGEREREREPVMARRGEGKKGREKRCLGSVERFFFFGVSMLSVLERSDVVEIAS